MKTNFFEPFDDRVCTDRTWGSVGLCCRHYCDHSPAEWSFVEARRVRGKPVVVRSPLCRSCALRTARAQGIDPPFEVGVSDERERDTKRWPYEREGDLA